MKLSIVVRQALLLAATACAARQPALLEPDSERFRATAPAAFRVRFETTDGDFVVEARRDWAPAGVDRFYNLVRNGFYDGAAFFRIVPDFVVQFGLSGDPRVAAAWRAQMIPDDPVREANTRGRLTFAMSGPGTRTTQLFINLGDNRRLDAMGFAPLGEVVEGMEVVQRLHAGYGEGPPMGRGPDQGRIMTEGDAYLKQSFAQLDYVKRATIVGGR
jgi:peptidyl-prolyl cis-trans isomerase A (cyclophilin A)